jgi:multidrug efflux system membrane fusion protein
LAKNDLARAEKLFRAKAISAEEHDARSKGYQEILAAVKSAEASVETARLNLEFTQIHSPIDGRVSKESITAGNLVNGTGSDATVLTTVVSTDPVYVYLAADERTVLKYRRQAQQLKQSTDLKNTPVQLALADEANFPHQGHLNYISPREDLATGTITLRAVFSNPDDLLTPGYFARIRVRGSSPYAGMLVPDRAIGTDQSQRFVWVVNQDNQVEYRKVVLGAHIDKFMVISEGLQANDWLVVEGLQKLKPGIKVEPERISLVETEQER